MHELQIVESVVEMVEECREGRTVRRVRLEIGRRGGVAPDVLRFYFELATFGTALQDARLDITVRPGRTLAVRSVEVA